MWRLSVAAIFLAIATCFTPHALAQSPGKEMYLGNQAFQKGKYQEATEHFEKCVALAPENVFAHLSLAAAYSQQFVPGVNSADNNRFAEKAIEQYQYVLDNSPVTTAKLTSAKGIGYLYLQMKKFDQAKEYYHTAASLDSSDPETYYWIGVLDLTVSYRVRQQERQKLGMGDNDSLPGRNKNVCAQVRDKNAAIVQDGIDSLTTALQLRSDYDDAMACMNLLYRERADIQCDDPAARAGDLKTADEWAAKAAQIRQAKAEEAKAREARAREAKAREAKAKKVDRNSEPVPTNPP